MKLRSQLPVFPVKGIKTARILNRTRIPAKRLHISDERQIVKDYSFKALHCLLPHFFFGNEVHSAVQLFHRLNDFIILQLLLPCVPLFL